MTDFDDFLKKKDEEIRKKTKDKQAKDAEVKERFATITRLAPIEWAKVLPTVLAVTEGHVIDDKGLFPTPGGSSVTLGSVHLVLGPSYGRSTGTPQPPQYLAEYKTAGELRELARVDIDPHLSETDILWKVSALNQPNPISTLQLADALARKLVEVYQDHET
jgi:hypothetical protein